MKSPYIYIVIVYLRVSYLRVCKMQQYIMILLYTVAEFFSSKYADFFAQKQTQTESLSELFFRILFLHLLIGVCLIIKYSIVRLLYCFCWLLHIVYDVWTGTPYQCRCAGCSRLFAGITKDTLYNVPDVCFRENDGKLVFQLHNCLKIWLCFVEHLSTIFWGKYNVVLAIPLRM